MVPPLNQLRNLLRIPRKTLSDYVKRGRGAEKLESGIKAVFSAGDEDQQEAAVKCCEFEYTVNNCILFNLAI
jgi:hypothetical protein